MSGRPKSCISWEALNFFFFFWPSDAWLDPENSVGFISDFSRLLIAQGYVL